MKKKSVTKVLVTGKVQRLTHCELSEWMQKQKGPRSIAQYAHDIGMTREAITGIMTGRRDPGRKAQKHIGIKAVEKLYIVEG